MSPKGKNDYCQRCEDFNTILYGVCCKCLWHVTDNRPSTEEEQGRVKKALDDAIAALEKSLED